MIELQEVNQMVSVKVIPEKGVEYSVYEKNGKHRVYFKVNNGGGRPLEVGNYDIIEGKFFPARGATLVWNVVEKDDNPQALIVIGDSKQIFVGKSKSAPAPATRSSWGGNSNNNNRDRDIKRGMCFNNATALVANNPAYHAVDDDEVVEAIMELTDKLFTQYMKRFGN
jgi:hypothetical protein|tara:strand:+ start:259 stop:762 length:504 start_codon:yes stop_codon:yes gene_type:complete